MKVKLKSYKKEFIEANRSTAYEFIKPKEMKAKEKAKKLVDRFKSGHVIFSANSKGNFQSPYTSGFMWESVTKHQSKQFALIAVDEMIEQWQTKNMGWHCDCVHHGEMYNYWQEVKQEIEKL